MRELVFDTETTGLDPRAGHRLVEIGCVEMVNGMPSGETFHTYLNPQRDMPDEAFQVHGLSSDFLSDKPLFETVAEAFVTFVSDARLVIHNAQFDMGFINAELDRLGMPPLKNEVVDTVTLARRKFPGQRVSLDALCERMGVDNSRRTKHGALLDAELLADVYIELTGGRQRGLDLVGAGTEVRVDVLVAATHQERRPPRPHAPSAAELAAHAAFLAKLKNPIWLLEAAAA
ncbi:DNA polymerase III subunit epsilon [Reyranella sp. CPCC 100927]|uniref:DNA polymerase III subunit epsilon n=1 Tax=Reyranella sp. CPCC 100927 TaxID=2599616 RepID=UPI0011B5FF32|nr:DNA polymerase III subunit epsilon [Reyranella sp. CPCC 100927]TWT15043.1 DNA polymerase III subunit epsilon [Reyranella sp. CPCC 100927]